METKELNLKSLIEYINQKEVFWVKDLRELLECKTMESSESANWHISKTIKALVRRNLIQCSERKGSERQYITLKKIKREDLDFKTILTGRRKHGK